jgi:hypothetical protein
VRESAKERREVEESVLLASVTRKRLMKTLQAGRDSVLLAMMCKVWRLPVAL